MHAETEWRPHATVAVVVERDGRFLCVEETARGQLVINQPAGHLDPGETLAAAAVREALEESAWDVALEHLIAVYQWTSPHSGEHFLRFTYAARALRHHPERTLDEGITRALWLTPEDLRSGAYQPRSSLVLRSIEDYQRGRQLPLDTTAWVD